MAWVPELPWNIKAGQGRSSDEGDEDMDVWACAPVVDTYPAPDPSYLQYLLEMASCLEAKSYLPPARPHKPVLSWLPHAAAQPATGHPQQHALAAPAAAHADEQHQQQQLTCDMDDEMSNHMDEDSEDHMEQDSNVLPAVPAVHPRPVQHAPHAGSQTTAAAPSRPARAPNSERKYLQRRIKQAQAGRGRGAGAAQRAPASAPELVRPAARRPGAPEQAAGPSGPAGTGPATAAPAQAVTRHEEATTAAAAAGAAVPATAAAAAGGGQSTAGPGHEQPTHGGPSRAVSLMQWHENHSGGTGRAVSDEEGREPADMAVLSLVQPLGMRRQPSTILPSSQRPAPASRTDTAAQATADAAPVGAAARAPAPEEHGSDEEPVQLTLPVVRRRLPVGPAMPDLGSMVKLIGGPPVRTLTGSELGQEMLQRERSKADAGRAEAERLHKLRLGLAPPPGARQQPAATPAPVTLKPTVRGALAAAVVGAATPATAGAAAAAGPAASPPQSPAAPAAAAGPRHKGFKLPPNLQALQPHAPRTNPGAGKPPRQQLSASAGLQGTSRQLAERETPAIQALIQGVIDSVGQTKGRILLSLNRSYDPAGHSGTVGMGGDQAPLDYGDLFDDEEQPPAAAAAVTAPVAGAPAGAPAAAPAPPSTTAVARSAATAAAAAASVARTAAEEAAAIAAAPAAVAAAQPPLAAGPVAPPVVARTAAEVAAAIAAAPAAVAAAAPALAAAPVVPSVAGSAAESVVVAPAAAAPAPAPVALSAATVAALVAAAHAPAAVPAVAPAHPTDDHGSSAPAQPLAPLTGSTGSPVALPAPGSTELQAQSPEGLGAGSAAEAAHNQGSLAIAGLTPCGAPPEPAAGVAGSEGVEEEDEEMDFLLALAKQLASGSGNRGPPPSEAADGAVPGYTDDARMQTTLATGAAPGDMQLDGVGDAAAETAAPAGQADGGVVSGPGLHGSASACLIAPQSSSYVNSLGTAVSGEQEGEEEGQPGDAMTDSGAVEDSQGEGLGVVPAASQGAAGGRKAKARGQPRAVRQQGAAGTSGGNRTAHKRILSITEGAAGAGQRAAGPTVEVGLYADIKAHDKLNKRQRRTDGPNARRPTYEVIEKAPCKHWRLGRCTFGDECRFSHEGETVSRLVPCKHVLSGQQCTAGDACRYSHVPGLKEPCKTLIVTGTCPAVPRCPYAHTFTPPQMEVLRSHHQFTEQGRAKRQAAHQAQSQGHKDCHLKM